MKEAIYAVLLSFAVSGILCPVLIPILHKLKFGQQIREEGPQGHQKKSGTPTMGGIAFLAAILVTGLIFSVRSLRILPVLFVTVGFGLIGFLDDYLKIVKKQSEGLKPMQKMAGQIVITAAFCYYMIAFSGFGTQIRIPFTGTCWTMPVWLYILFLFFAVLGTDNGVNFTDGLDGLCSSVTAVVAVFFTVQALEQEAGLAPVSAAVFGALMGFLLFNVYPAKIFMGDTGSLALGGFVAAMAFMLQMPVYIAIVGFIYLIEVLSVILQVAYFKATKGKRIFRMAPIHHHFELGGLTGQGEGWSETRVVCVFTIVTVLLCLLACLV